MVGKTNTGVWNVLVGLLSVKNVSTVEGIGIIDTTDVVSIAEGTDVLISVAITYLPIRVAMCLVCAYLRM